VLNASNIYKYPFFQQKGNFDCGIACVKMIAQYYGSKFNDDSLGLSSNTSFSIRSLYEMLRNIGIICRALDVSVEALEELCQISPVILHWNKNHFVVIYSSFNKNGEIHFLIADPKLNGIVIYNKHQLEKGLNFNDCLNEARGYILSTVNI